MSTHLRKLEDAGYVRMEKAFVGKRPRTTVHLTGVGRSAWMAWIGQMQAIIRAAE
ncbi:MAG: transcriptional regulator [Pseudomonadota bacterium]